MRVGVNEVWLPLGLFAVVSWLWSLRTKGFLCCQSFMWLSLSLLWHLCSLSPVWRAFVVSCTQIADLRKPIGTPLPPVLTHSNRLLKGGFSKNLQHCSMTVKATFSSETGQLGFPQIYFFCLSALQHQLGWRSSPHPFAGPSATRAWLHLRQLPGQAGSAPASRGQQFLQTGTWWWVWGIILCQVPGQGLPHFSGAPTSLVGGCEAPNWEEGGGKEAGYK